MDQKILDALKTINDKLGGTNDPNENWGSLLQEIAQNVGSGGGGSDLPEVTSADNGNVLGVVGGEWGKTNPGYTITRQQLTIFENEAVTREVIGNNIRYSFDELTRESDLPEMPGFSNTCWIRLPEEFVQAIIAGKDVKVVFRMDSEPMPDSTNSECAYTPDGLDGDRITVFLQASYSDPEKWGTNLYSYEGGGGFQGGARYLDDSTIPALDNPDDYGWYFSVKRSVASVLGTNSWDAERYAPAPETASITVYLEMVDVEFDKDYKEALVDAVGYKPTPVLSYYSDSGAGWILYNFDPDKADPDVFDGGAGIPVLIAPEMFYLANDPDVEGYDVSSFPISGSLSVGFDLVDGVYVPNYVEIFGASLVFITDPSDDYSLVAARLESYYAELYREQDPDTGEYSGWTEWNVSRNSITDLTSLTTYGFTPLTPDGDDSGDVG